MMNDDTAMCVHGSWSHSTQHARVPKRQRAATGRARLTGETETSVFVRSHVLAIRYICQLWAKGAGSDSSTPPPSPQDVVWSGGKRSGVGSQGEDLLEKGLATTHTHTRARANSVLFSSFLRPRCFALLRSAFSAAGKESVGILNESYSCAPSLVAAQVAAVRDCHHYFSVTCSSLFCQPMFWRCRWRSC